MSFLELLITLTLALLITQFSLGSFKSSITFKAHLYADELVQKLKFAQLMALKTGQTIEICPAPPVSTQRACGTHWQNGLYINQVSGSTFHILGHLAPPPAPLALCYSGFPSSKEVTFTGTGFGNNSTGSFLLKSQGKLIKKVSLNRLGGTRIKK